MPASRPLLPRHFCRPLVSFVAPAWWSSSPICSWNRSRSRSQFAYCDLSMGCEAVFRDPESGLEVSATVADVRSAYRETVEEAIAEWRDTLQSTGTGYEVFTTDTPFGVPLRKAFAARQRLP